jgi:ParB-like chromosome segregation protein Spo0J
VRLEDLHAGRFGRERGIDPSHVAALAEVPEAWPPILVARADHSIIDGQHRVAAARDLGLVNIRASFFDGSPDDAYIEFVRRNVGHGLPLGLAERRHAARRMLAADPSRSDRGIAKVCGLSPKTIGKIRSQGDGGSRALAAKRVGRDGRLRPVDAADLRARITRELEAQPSAPLRQIARQVGASPETVRSVKLRLHQDRRPQPPSGGATVVGLSTQRARRLGQDVAFASREGCQGFTKLFDTTGVDRAVLLAHIDDIPLSRIYDVADEARRRAAHWREFADVLESRVRRRA